MGYFGDNNYISDVIKTESQIDDQMRDRLLEKRTVRLLHGILGLNSEIEELALAIENNDRVNTKEESGDCFWYCGVILDEIDVNPQISDNPKLFYSIEDEMNRIIMTASKLSDIIKKYIYYGREYSLEDIEFGTTNIIISVAAICDSFGYNYREVQDRNIGKLKVRYKHKFSTDEANSRDLQQELVALAK